MDYLVHDLLRTSAQRFPDRVCLVEDDTSLSFAETWRQAQCVAAAFQQLGLRAGQRRGDSVAFRDSSCCLDLRLLSCWRGICSHS